MISRFTLLLATLAQGIKCPQYVCNPPDVKWPDSLCAIERPSNSSQIALNPKACHVGEYCEIPESSSGPWICQPDSESAGVALPGEPCDELHTCKFSQCLDNTCTFSGHLQPCKVTWDCGVEHTCFLGVCYPLSPIGGECTQSYDCVQSAGCDIVKGGYVGVCVEYLSVPAQQSVKQCNVKTNLGTNFLCESTLCYKGSSGEFLCTGLVQSQTQIPATAKGFWCTSTTDPNSSLTAAVSNFVCGYDGFNYCPLFPGDGPMLAYLNATRQYIASPEIRKCNTYRKYGNKMIDYVDNWCAQAFFKPSKQMIYDYYFALYYPQVVHAEECAIEVLMPAFYDASKQLRNRQWDFGR